MEVLAQYRDRAFFVQQFYLLSPNRCVIKIPPHLERTNGMCTTTLVHPMEMISDNKKI